MKKATRSFGRMIRDNRGVAAIEFALIAPMLLLILVGAVDYGLFINKRMQLQELSRRAAEYVVQGGQESDVMDNIIKTSDLYNTADSTRTGQITYDGEIQCECANGVASTDSTCQTPCPTDGDYLRSYFAVTITGSYTPLLPWTGINSSITMTGYSREQYAR